MNWVALSLGSNIDPVDNLTCCLDELLLHFRDLALSSVFESEAVGFTGDNFLNMVVAFETELDLPSLSALLKGIEDKCGRDRSAPRFSGRTLDIDVLLYGDQAGLVAGIDLPRPEILENAYVLWPLSQVAKKRRHPLTGQRFTDHWRQFDKGAQRLWPVDFRWHGRMISVGE